MIRDPEPTAGPSRSRVGLALAGGAPGGAVYEIGALRALDEAIEGLDLNDLDVYVGVSAGGFIGACLVNRLTTAQMCRAIMSEDPGEHPFVPETFLKPLFSELRRVAAIPKLLAQSVWNYALHPRESLLTHAVARLGQALPVGCFDNEPIRAYLEKIFTLKDRTDDFRKLRRPLYVVATDLDSGKAVRFGAPGWDHVPISRAVQASTALPGLYTPVEIDGRSYVDGILLKTMHASVAFEAGANLVLCVNPIVPVDTARAIEEGILKGPHLTERGLPTVLTQAVRTLIHSRLETGIAAYEKRYGADIVLLEPKRQDYEMFFTNIFGFADRRAVCEHAYRATRRELLARFDELAPVFERHGLELRRDVLEDPARRLWAGVGLPHLDILPARPLLGTNGSPARPKHDLDVVAQLDAVLDRLERLVEREGAARVENG
jgi:predicted acylesterase/phospholipase RssA